MKVARGTRLSWGSQSRAGRLGRILFSSSLQFRWLEVVWSRARPIRLLKNLTTDPIWVRLGILMGYLALPVDLIPDFHSHPWPGRRRHVIVRRPAQRCAPSRDRAIASTLARDVGRLRRTLPPGQPPAQPRRRHDWHHLPYVTVRLAGGLAYFDLSGRKWELAAQGGSEVV